MLAFFCGVIASQVIAPRESNHDEDNILDSVHAVTAEMGTARSPTAAFRSARRFALIGHCQRWAIREL